MAVTQTPTKAQAAAEKLAVECYKGSAQSQCRSDLMISSSTHFQVIGSLH
jgi:hypothetical protein